MRRAEDVVTHEPLNAETSWDGLGASVTPVGDFYTRNNHAIPRLDPGAWRLALSGFRAPASLTLDALRALPAVAHEVVLECAGNGRSFFEPKPEGTPWRERAVGCARFRGARLRDVLARAGVPPDAVELVFSGADQGEHRFERSLPLEVALADDTILAYEMNGAPLEPEHGAPVRLVVPGWYGIASVKWLVGIRASRAPFVGHFQTERYVYQRDAQDPRVTPVREKRVNSLIVSPAPDARVEAGRKLRVRGWAWSGSAPILRVEVSIDGGRSWEDAQLDAMPEPHAWRGWSIDVLPAVAGERTLLARAHDAAGQAQPDRPEWNVHGYGYNAPRPRRIVVSARQLA